jgi:galactarate dehydratase
VALADIAEGARWCCGYACPSAIALKAHPLPAAGVHERPADAMPGAGRMDGLPMATAKRPPRRRSKASPSRATATRTARSARATSWRSPRPCSAWPACRDSRWQRIKAELLRRTRTSTTSSALEHTYGCGVAHRRAGRGHPDPHAAQHLLNPNFGGEVMVVSLGCEKLQPDALLPPGSFPIATSATATAAGARRGVPAGRRARRLHVDGRSILAGDAAPRALNARRRETVPASELVVGVQCGGSDAFSGVTANPAVGLLHRPAGARRRHRDVLREHRGARRHRSAHRARATPEWRRR